MTQLSLKVEAALSRTSIKVKTCWVSHRTRGSQLRGLSILAPSGSTISTRFSKCPWRMTWDMRTTRNANKHWLESLFCHLGKCLYLRTRRAFSALHCCRTRATSWDESRTGIHRSATAQAAHPIKQSGHLLAQNMRHNKHDAQKHIV